MRRSWQPAAEAPSDLAEAGGELDGSEDMGLVLEVGGAGWSDVRKEVIGVGSDLFHTRMSALSPGAGFLGSNRQIS